MEHPSSIKLTPAGFVASSNLIVPECPRFERKMTPAQINFGTSVSVRVDFGHAMIGSTIFGRAME